MSITWFHMKIINMVEILKWSWHFLGRLSDFWQKNWLALKFLGIFSESSNVYTGTPYSGWGQYEPLVSTQTPCISLTRGSLSWLVATREADTRGLSWYSGFVFCPHPSWGPGIDTMPNELPNPEISRLIWYLRITKVIQISLFQFWIGDSPI